ncbi:MAG: sigma-70 family RNA polymerase sigma factor [Solirubrobacteraceae bacterium]
MIRDRYAYGRACRGWRGDDLVALFRRSSTGDAQAREAIILRFQPLARRLARRYDGRGEPFEDLLQVASVGLIKAVDRCSPERGEAFVAYAQPMILGEIRRYFRDATWRVHVPRTVKDRAQRVAQADQAARTSANRPTTTDEIAVDLDLDPAAVAEAQRAWAAYRPASLDAMRRAPDGRMAARGEPPGGAEADYERAEVSIGVARALRGLGRRDQTVVLLRLCCDLTQDEIASRVGVSQVHISRILRTANAAVASACGLAATDGGSRRMMGTAELEPATSRA